MKGVVLAVFNEYIQTIRYIIIAFHDLFIHTCMYSVM